MGIIGLNVESEVKEEQQNKAPSEDERSFLLAQLKKKKNKNKH